MFLMLPDSPVDARFFNDRQRAIAVKRVAENRVRSLLLLGHNHLHHTANATVDSDLVDV